VRVSSVATLLSKLFDMMVDGGRGEYTDMSMAYRVGVGEVFGKLTELNIIDMNLERPKKLQVYLFVCLFVCLSV